MYLSDGSLLRDQPSQLPKVLMKGSPLKRADWVKKPLSSDGSVHMEISKAMVFSETSDRIALTETSEKMGDSHLLYLSQCTPQIFSSTISLPLSRSSTIWLSQLLSNAATRFVNPSFRDFDAKSKLSEELQDVSDDPVPPPVVNWGLLQTLHEGRYINCLESGAKLGRPRIKTTLLIVQDSAQGLDLLVLHRRGNIAGRQAGQRAGRRLFMAVQLVSTVDDTGSVKVLDHESCAIPRLVGPLAMSRSTDAVPRATKCSIYLVPHNLASGCMVTAVSRASSCRPGSEGSFRIRSLPQGRHGDSSAQLDAHQFGYHGLCGGTQLATG
ncbi:hypothetical protein PgNI_05138 [Pyricularia grisea]|uniref:Uncharacterized protein n=1 Tax=Pyricularia grisea TaxID=148305 RepID=A0A6P8B3L2_PYRGI|nr:hypothetical protein PgNI_05138 [Pyricularia grisea]TLD09931.1 hypothetical protein PgNI_05138 [Pyricularia grisea]